MFAQEVPDRETIPSHLQRLANDRGADLGVLNFGTIAMTTSQLVERLLLTDVRPGDLVIFYGGLNDLYYLAFSGYQGGWLPGRESFRPIQRLGWYHRLAYRYLFRLRSYSAAVRMVTDFSDRTKPVTVTDQDMLDINVANAGREYARALGAAHAYVTGRDGRFLNFLQPTLFTQSRRSPYEEGLLANYLMTPPGADVAVTKGYPVLRRQMASLTSQGIESFDVPSC